MLREIVYVVRLTRCFLIYRVTAANSNNTKDRSAEADKRHKTAPTRTAGSRSLYFRTYRESVVGQLDCEVAVVGVSLLDPFGGLLLPVFRRRGCF